MTLTVTGRHLAVTPQMRTQIQRQVARLERLLNDAAVSAQCIVWQERQHHVCELTVHARGDHTLHGVGREPRLGPAVSAAVAKVAQQAKKLKGRWQTRRRAERGRPAGPEAPAVPEAPRGPRVIRSRRYEVKPMRLDDAVLALTSRDLSFLVFRDAGTEGLSIVYRRPDGHVGLIEPEA